MKKSTVGLYCAGLFMLGMASTAGAALVTYSVEADVQLSSSNDDYNLDGAHMSLSVTMDSNQPSHSSLAETNYDRTAYSSTQTSATFTNRPNAAADTTVSGFNMNSLIYNFHLSAVSDDIFDMGVGSFGSGEFSGLSSSGARFLLASDVFGADGFAALPTGWTASQLLNPVIGEVFYFSAPNFESYDLTVTAYSVSTVPVPAAAWLFGSGLLGLVGVARRKKAA